MIKLCQSTAMVEEDCMLQNVCCLHKLAAVYYCLLGGKHNKNYNYLIRRILVFYHMLFIIRCAVA